MKTFNVIEKFVSIDGEGPMAGALAIFIRFRGCNLRCSWCDTTYSWDYEAKSEEMSISDLYEYIKDQGVKHITLTGGEPLLQEGIEELLECLAQDESLLVHIETNGSVAIRPFKERVQIDRIRYIVDYKLPQSGMTANMNHENLTSVDSEDVYKFVIASHEDLNKAYEIIKTYNLDQRCKVYLSPVSEAIAPREIVEFMKIKELGLVKLQLQLHKIIWPKDCRGV